MEQKNIFILEDMVGDFRTYFNWSANALVPFNPHAADIFLEENQATIIKVAQELLKMVSVMPSIIYRGIILPEPATFIPPHKNLKYLSFSTEQSVAEHFADPKGFGAEIMNVESRLGKYGYVIEYRPKLIEIIYHYDFLSILPYAEGFSLLGMDGIKEVNSLKKQKEIIILQPTEPFANIISKTV